MQFDLLKPGFSGCSIGSWLIFTNKDDTSTSSKVQLKSIQMSLICYIRQKILRFCFHIIPLLKIQWNNFSLRNNQQYSVLTINNSQHSAFDNSAASWTPSWLRRLLPQKGWTKTIRISHSVHIHTLLSKKERGAYLLKFFLELRRHHQ